MSRVNVISEVHGKTKRDYIGRVNDNKVECRKIARKFDKDFFDGDRKFGYGGYRYIPGWWNSVVDKILELYDLPLNAKVLDIGAGKGFLLADLLEKRTDLKILGTEISDYAIENSHPTAKPYMVKHNAKDPFNFENQFFDLAISINSLHNLFLSELAAALPEISRVAKESLIVVESWRNEQELFNVECWNLTARSVHSESEWEWLFNNFKYKGNYDFIYFT